MTFASAILRVLLVLALLVNGMAGAMASPGRAGAPGVRSTECHGHASMAQHRATVITSSASTSHSHPDHCVPDHCDCACMSFLQATAPLVARLPAIPNRSHGVPMAIAGHSDPALPHLIRPPIG